MSIPLRSLEREICRKLEAALVAALEDDQGVYIRETRYLLIGDSQGAY